MDAIHVHVQVHAELSWAELTQSSLFLVQLLCKYFCCQRANAEESMLAAFRMDFRYPLPLSLSLSPSLSLSVSRSIFDLLKWINLKILTYFLGWPMCGILMMSPSCAEYGHKLHLHFFNLLALPKSIESQKFLNEAKQLKTVERIAGIHFKGSWSIGERNAEGGIATSIWGGRINFE